MFAVSHYRLATGHASASTSFCGKRDAPIHESGFSDAPALVRRRGAAVAVNVVKLPELLWRR